MINLMKLNSHFYLNFQLKFHFFPNQFHYLFFEKKIKIKMLKVIYLINQEYKEIYYISKLLINIQMLLHLIDFLSKI